MNTRIPAAAAPPHGYVDMKAAEAAILDWAASPGGITLESATARWLGVPVATLYRETAPRERLSAETMMLDALTGLRRKGKMVERRTGLGMSIWRAA